MNGLALRDLALHYGDTAALDGIDLSIAPGEVLAVTGPSGAGKTSLCRLIAGLERPSRGAMQLGASDLAQVPARRRRVSFLFESYALFPHMTVFDNAASPLRAPGQVPALDAAEVEARVGRMLSLLAIDRLGARLPAELSGGQKQRVGLARALVQEEAAITLLDEPISHLDAKLRHCLRGEIKRLLAARRAPALWATPDGLEALSVGDRVAVLVDGRIEQLALPQEIWSRPASVRVARLIGDPPMSLLAGRIAGEGEPPALLAAGGLALPLPASLAHALRPVGAVILGIKPRAVRFNADPPPGQPLVEIHAVEPFGKLTVVSARIGTELLRAKLPGGTALQIGQRVGLQVAPDDLVAFDGATGLAIDLPRRAAQAA